MNKKILFILCFYLLPLSKGNASEGLNLNGYDWQNLSSGSRTYFVIGWAKCGKFALDNLFLRVDKLDESIKNANIQQKIFKDEGILLGGTTIGQLVDTISELYSDSRLKTMDITEIMPLVTGRLTGGWTMKSIDELIAIKSKLYQCEKENGQLSAGCSSLRVELNTYLQKIKNGHD